jgi:hypothetical protein
VDQVKYLDLESGEEIIKVRIVLKRRYLYHMLTAFLPTSCLIIIVHATHYFPQDNFEAAVMVCLTGMLVMTTLLLQVSSALPPTGK